MLIAAIVATALLAAVVFRDRLHPLLAGGVAAVGAGGLATWLKGCAWGGGIEVSQTILGTAAMLAVGVGLAGGVAAVRSGEGAGSPNCARAHSTCRGCGRSCCCCPP